MALNLALGVQCASYQIPVHRNSLKPKATTMAGYVANNPSPASKYGALQVPTTTHRNLVTSRRGKRITVAAALQGIVAPAPTPTTTKITVDLENHIGLDFTLKSSYLVKGGALPANAQTISKSPVQFKVDSAADGISLILLAYTISGSVDWVVAWKYKPGSADNKIYTRILPASTEYNTQVWTGLYNQLMQQHGPSSVDEDKIYLAQADLGVAADNSPTVKGVFTYT